MNTRCTVCHHPQRAEIEQAHVAGETLRSLAKRFDRAKSTIQRHLTEHVPDHTQKALDAAGAREIEAGDTAPRRTAAPPTSDRYRSFASVFNNVASR